MILHVKEHEPDDRVLGDCDQIWKFLTGPGSHDYFETVVCNEAVDEGVVFPSLRFLAAQMSVFCAINSKCPFDVNS